MAALARSFMQAHQVPALSVAIGYGGALLYRRAFGWADQQDAREVTSDHVFRIASVTKPITSVAIFSLIEQGRLKLDAPVFGRNGLLGDWYGSVRPGSSVEGVTIEHLLTHTAGGWVNDRADPMFQNPLLGHQALISQTLRDRPLDHPPGQVFGYSNFGYCLLGRVIEAASGQSYSAFVKNTVLSRCGVDAMDIGGNTRGQQRADEVTYYDQDGLDPYGMNVSRMDSHGGWLAKPSDIVRFLMRVDRSGGAGSLLRKDTIDVMTIGSMANPRYAKGWFIYVPKNNWWHDGSLPGTSTIAVRTHTGFCWAGFTNTRRQNSSMGADLDQLIWRMAGQVRAWRAG